MSRLHALSVTVLVFLLLAGCGQAPPPAAPDTRAADQKAIMAGETAWAADWESRDVENIVDHYADSASVLLPDVPEMKGKNAIRAGLKTFLADKDFSLTFTPETVEPSKAGDLAYSHGTYTMTATSAKTKKPVTEQGKYVTVYRKLPDGSWKAIFDIENADAPAK